MKQDLSQKKFFGKYPVFYIRWVYLLVIVIFEIILIGNSLPNALLIACIELAFLVENILKIWVVKNYKWKIVCYVFDVIFLFFLNFLSDGTLISSLYIVVLTEFYLTQKKMGSCIVMAVSATVVFVVTTSVSAYLIDRSIVIEKILSSVFNDLIIIFFHFLIVSFASQVYRKNREINKINEELHEINRKLQDAYAHLQEVAVLEERQRIARDIHDTAGHSITTVIMQTEAAKLIIDSDPEEAKRKICSANLQAKRTLEEIRESMHLLSGVTEQKTLKDSIMSIIHDSTDGTDIVIRSNVEDIALCDAKSRFLLNTLKEGISNGLRHGGATAFWVSLTQEEGKVCFELSDNGKGARLGELKEGFGLSGMRSRIESLGGSLRFETEPDEGFVIRAELPADGEKK